MPTLTFNYSALDETGRKFKGAIEAETEHQALDTLRQRGDKIIELKQSDQRSRFKLERRATEKDVDLADFAADLKSLLETGASLPKSLSILSDRETHTAVTVIARDMQLKLENGEAASSVLLRSKNKGTQLLGRFIHAAELAGGYELMLGIAAEFLSKRSEAAEKIRSALSYPIFLLVSAVLAVIFLIIFVSPTILPLFEDGGAPLFIEVTAGLGNFVQAHYSLTMLTLAAFVLLIFGLAKSGLLNTLGSGFIQKAPFINKIASDMDYGPVTLALAALLDARWGADRALLLASNLSTGPAAGSFSQAANKIRDGSTFYEGVRAIKAIPQEVKHAISLGEATGNSSVTLNRTGAFLVRRALRRLNRLAAILAPVLILAIGALIASLMISVMSSLTALGDVALD